MSGKWHKARWLDPDHRLLCINGTTAACMDHPHVRAKLESYVRNGLVVEPFMQPDSIRSSSTRSTEEILMDILVLVADVEGADRASSWNRLREDYKALERKRENAK